MYGCANRKEIIDLQHLLEESFAEIAALTPAITDIARNLMQGSFSRIVLIPEMCSSRQPLLTVKTFYAKDF